MANYFSTELGLTKATRALLANTSQIKPPAPIIFDDQAYVRQDNRPVKRYEPKKQSKRNITSFMTETEVENFQQHRIFSIIRNS